MGLLLLSAAPPPQLGSHKPPAFRIQEDGNCNCVYKPYHPKDIVRSVNARRIFLVSLCNRIIRLVLILPISLWGNDIPASFSTLRI